MSTTAAPQVARVVEPAGLDAALGTLGAPRGVPVIVLVGAGTLDDAAAERLAPSFATRSHRWPGRSVRWSSTAAPTAA